MPRSRRSISSFRIHGRRSDITSAGWCSRTWQRCSRASSRRAARYMRLPTGRITPSRCRPCSAPSRCSSRRSAALLPDRRRNSRRGASDWDTRSAICTFADEKRQQLVEEEPPALARAHALHVTMDEAFPVRLGELLGDHGERQARALLEEGKRKALDEPERVQHELERQL